MLDVKIVRKSIKRWPEKLVTVNKAFLPAAGVIVLKDTVRNIRALKIVDTGRLRSSYHSTVGRDDVSVGTNVNYAPYQEYGTRFQPARPHLRPALDTNRKGLLALWRQLFRRVYGR